jgi:hypothetical protein
MTVTDLGNSQFRPTPAASSGELKISIPESRPATISSEASPPGNWQPVGSP